MASSAVAVRERFSRTRAELVAITVAAAVIVETPVSEDGSVAVSVGPRGELQQLRLDPRIYRTTDSVALADTILQTIWRAQRQSSARLVELASFVLGSEVNGVALADQFSRVPTMTSAT